MTGVKGELESFIGRLYLETKDHILKVEGKEIQIGDATEMEGDNGMLVHDVIASCVQLGADDPPMDANVGFAHPVEMQFEDLSVMKRGVAFKP